MELKTLKWPLFEGGGNTCRSWDILSPGTAASQAALRKPHVLVNRVSDAAAPPLAKATLTLLAAAERTGVRVINGAKAYGTGMSKVLHHVALEGAGLATPRSLMVRALPPPGGLGGLRFPLLLKPNSGVACAWTRRNHAWVSLRIIWLL